MITTKRLKERLQAGETLTFIYPAKYTNNSRDLKVVVLPTNLLPHEVYVEGIHQYSLYGSELQEMWFKGDKRRTPWEKDFNKEWRYLLSLNWPEVYDGNSDLLYYIQDKVYQFYLRGKRKKGAHKRHPLIPNPNWPKHKIVLKATQRPVEEFRYVMDVCTKAVEKVSVEVAKDLIERFEHYDYCKRRDYRHYMRSLNSIIVRPDKPLYWKDEPEEVKDEKGIKIDVLNFMPKVNPKDKIDQDQQMILNAKDHTRKERRDWKHKKRLYDRHARYMTIKIPPKDDDELEKFRVKQIIFDYEYGPRFTNGKQMFDKNGDPIMKKYYVGKREEYVTIEESPRTIYKTIVTKQYPGDLSRKRGIIKRNIELLKKYQAEQQKTEEAVKSE